MGSPSTSCSKATNLSSKVQVRWSYGKIDSIAKFGGKDSKNSKSSWINNGANLEVISTWDYDSFGTSFKTAFDSQFNTKCYGKKNCQIDLSKLSFPTTWNSTNNAYLKIYCNSDSIVETTRSKAAYIIIWFDFAWILFIWIAFEVHDTYERLENIEINDKILDGSDFTVEISNIPYHDDVRILKAQTWKYIEQILQKSIQEDPKIQDPNWYKIAQCNLALTKYSIMSNYKARLRFEKEFKILNIKENILKNSIANQNKIDKEKMNIEKKRIKLKAKSDENEKAILELKRTLDVKAVRIYITMQSMEGKDKLIEMFYSNKHRRWCGLIKSKSHQLQNNKIVIKEAPKASTINWENLAISKSKRWIRISIVYLFSLLLIIISFAVMIITKNYQRELNDEYNTSSCSSTVTMDQALQDYLNTKGERAGFMFCYCQQQYNDMGYSVKDIVFTNGETYWSTWYTDYVSAILLVYVLAFTMQIINVVVKTILRLASKLEKRENKHEEVISNIFKMSLTQLINSAILLLIVNMKLEFMPTWFPVFAGDYNDFSASWYTYVGSTIMIMMLFSIITPHIANFFLHFVRFTIRWFDRGWTRDVKRTKKIFQIDYETLYLGPEYLIEFRYSNMIVMVYLALLFGGGMPILYFFAAWIFCVTYWIDKITLLRIYRKPPRFGIEVIRFARNMLIVGVILHFGFNFWMYSNSLVFNSYSDNLFKFGTQTIDSISNVT